MTNKPMWLRWDMHISHREEKRMSCVNMRTTVINLFIISPISIYFIKVSMWRYGERNPKQTSKSSPLKSFRNFCFNPFYHNWYLVSSIYALQKFQGHSWFLPLSLTPSHNQLYHLHDFLNISSQFFVHEGGGGGYNAMLPSGLSCPLICMVAVLPSSTMTSASWGH